MWDERYKSAEYAYGTEPNDFLRAYAHCLPKGKVLSLAEGEGRNAVYLARLGYEITAVDASAVGLEKARKLADLHGVTVNFVHADLADFDLGYDCWSGIVSIFCPLPQQARRLLHDKVTAGLENGGVYLVEAYRPDQVLRDTGGGKDEDVMQTKDSLIRELKGLNFEHLQELEREIIEGQYHTGTGSVVQAIAKKTA
ncbi:methyltransferase type 11 [Oleiphilus messinensis]|uniref:Methyltransferase type 11 n=1 Tax=Oleiphilus messinensis TaxID=141451 RepID=A0A1Y0I5X2_9GAMM|nr:class I SAM-dependent methyltransferase [Oleiphilus messinensis]ARU55609.1 methyltransferase type 11 [Oleiphilus messinensis]